MFSFENRTNFKNAVSTYWQKEKELFITICALFVLSRFSMVIIQLVFNQITGTQNSIISMLCQWDSGWYVSITENGYPIAPTREDNQTSWAFSPLYPMLVKLVKYIIPIGTEALGVILSNIFALFGTYFGTKFFIDRTHAKDYLPFVFLCLCGPYSFYFSTYYAEALFFMLFCLFMLSLSKKKYILAGVFSGLATATRSYGVFIVFIMLIWIYLENYDRLSFKNLFGFVKKIFTNSNYFLGILLCPLGHFIYMMYLYFLVGDVWAFYRVTAVAWGGKRNDGPLDIFKHLMDTNNSSEFYLAILFVIITFLIVYLFKNKYYPESFIGVITLVQHLSIQYNIARHFIAFGVVSIALAIFMNRYDKLKPIFYVSLFGIEMVLIYMWFSRAYWLI